MNVTNQKKFLAFIKRYKIKGRLIATILNYHISAIYQKLNFSYDVSDEDITNLKIGYYNHIKTTLEDLRKELKREGYQLD